MNTHDLNASANELGEKDRQSYSESNRPKSRRRYGKSIKVKCKVNLEV